MVRDYKRTTDRGSWSEESMWEAVKAVLNRKMGYYKAARQFSVPQTTLERKVNTARSVLNETSDENLPIRIKVPLGPKSPVFSKSEEEELYAYLVEMEERYGNGKKLTTKDLKALAYQFALKNNKPNPFNSEKEEAGREWIHGFLKRHPQLSIRKLENTSAARTFGLNKVSIQKIFNFNSLCGKPAIITSSPYKQELEVSAQKKKYVEQKKLKKIETQKRRDELKKQKKFNTKSQNKKLQNSITTAKTAKIPIVSSSENESEEDTPCKLLEESMTEELYRCKRRLIRLVATHMVKEKKPSEELWPDIDKEMGRDCQPLWERIRALTLKKLNRFLTIRDDCKTYSKPVQLSDIDWLLINEVLVHEKVDLIAQNSGKDYPQLVQLFELVQRFKVETLIGQELVTAWNMIVTVYNKKEQRGSLMLLQRRWYQMKAATRELFYKFWHAFRGNSKLLSSAKEFCQPTPLQMEIAKRYPNVITKPFPEWEELIEQELVVLYDDINVSKDNKSELCEEIEADIMLVEPQIETIDLEIDSDCENVTKVEKEIQTNINESINVSENSGTQQNTSQCEASNNVLQNDNTKIYIEINSHVPIKKEPEDVDGLSSVKIVETAHIPVEIIETDTKEANLESKQMVDQHIKGEDITLKQNTSTSDTICAELKSVESLEGKELSRVVDDNVRLNDVIKGKESECIENCKDIEVKEEQAIANPFDVLSDLNLIDDGIEFVDDGIEFVEEDVEYNISVPDTKIGTSQELQIQSSNSGNENYCPKFDVKLLMYPVVYTTKLDHMSILKHIPLSNVKDLNLINRIAIESKPISKGSVDINETQRDNHHDHKNQSSEIDETINDESRSDSQIASKKVELSSYLFQKPRNRLYNPVKLCKNPDFNTRLKRLTTGFFSSTRNIQLLNMCKPMTVDVDKRFESELINETLYLKLDCPDIKSSVETEQDTDIESKQTVSVVPSAMPVQSLIAYNMMLQTKMNADNVTTLSQKLPEENVLPERNKVIILPDIADVRRVNQQLLVAEVTPIQLQNTLKKHNPPVKIVPVANTNNSNEQIVSSNKNQNQIERSDTEDKQSMECSNELLVPRNNYSASTSRDESLEQSEIIARKSTVTNSNSVYKRKIERKRSVINPKKGTVHSKFRRNPYVPIDRTAIPWRSKYAQPHLNDALLTPDTLNKMLCVMGSDACDLTNVKVIRDLKGAARKSRTVENNVSVKSVNQSCQTDDLYIEIPENIEESNNDDKNKEIEKLKLKIRVESAKPRFDYSRERSCCWARGKMEKKRPSLSHKCPKDMCICCCRDDLILNRRKKTSDSISQTNSETTNSVPLVSESSPYIQNTFDSEKLSNPSESTKDNLENSHDKQISTTSNLEPLSPEPQSISNTDNVKPVDVIDVEKFANVKLLKANTCSCKQPNVSIDTFQRQIVIDGSHYCPSHSVQNSISKKNSKQYIYINTQNILDKTVENPILLGKNKILLTTVKFPKSLLNTSSLKKNEAQASKVTLTDNASSLKLFSTLPLPKGVELVLLPNSELTYSVNPGVVLDVEEMTALSAIVTAVQQQINASLLINTDVSDKEKCNEIKLSSCNNTEHNTAESNCDELKLNSNTEAETVAVENQSRNIIPNVDETQLNFLNHEGKQEPCYNINKKEPVGQIEMNCDKNEDNNVQNDKTILSENRDASVASENLISNINNDNTSENLTERSETVNEKISIEPSVVVNNDSKIFNINNDVETTEKTESNENRESVTPNNKTILSDLMEMVGISAEDTTPEFEDPTKESVRTSQITVQDELTIESEQLNKLQKELQLTSAPQSTLQKQFNITSDDVIEKKINIPDTILSNLQNSTDVNKLLELTPIRTYVELKYAYENNGAFFKLDFDNGVIVPINVCIKKNKKPHVNILPRKECTETIDLTDESDVLNVNNKKEEEKPIDTNTLLNVHSNLQKSTIEDVLVNKTSKNIEMSNTVRPLKLFKAIHPRILKRQRAVENRDAKNNAGVSIAQIPNRRKRKQSFDKIEVKINLVDSDAPMEEEYLVDSLDSDDDYYIDYSSDSKLSEFDSSSDDEPLAKKVKRRNIHNAEKLKIGVDEPNTKKLSSENSANNCDYNLNESRESLPVPIGLTSNDSSDVELQDDCILGF